MLMMAGVSKFKMLQSAQRQRRRHGKGRMPDWASWSVQEAAEKTGYNEQYLRRLIRQGKIEAARLGQVYLIRISSLQSYIDEMKESDDGRTGPKTRPQK